jgi:hypothetical protein
VAVGSRAELGGTITFPPKMPLIQSHDKYQHHRYPKNGDDKCSKAGHYIWQCRSQDTTGKADRLAYKTRIPS